MKRVRDGYVETTVPRDELRLAQTPQAFVASVLREAHRRAHVEGIRRTDDAALLEWAGFRVRVVPGEPSNFKITSPEDLARAAVADLLTTRDGDFEAAAKRVLQKNQELYRRLA